MKGLKGRKIGIAGVGIAALAFVGALVLATQAWAVAGSLTITDGSAAPGATVDVNVEANVPNPGLGALTADITYDSSVVAPADQNADGTVDEFDCPVVASGATGVCNPNYAAGTVRITIAHPLGLRGQATLYTLTFKCLTAGTSDLVLHTGDGERPFADATRGAPAPVAPATLNNGTITCAVASPTTVAPTATKAITIVNTGFGGGSDSGNGLWVLIALAAAGAGIASVGALRLRSRSS